MVAKDTVVNFVIIYTVKMPDKNNVCWEYQ